MYDQRDWTEVVGPGKGAMEQKQRC